MGMRRQTNWLLGASSLPFLLFLVVPIGALLYRASFADLLAAVQEESARQAIGLSLRTPPRSLSVISQRRARRSR
jgi:ABC-type sulfate transport system permease component